MCIVAKFRINSKLNAMKCLIETFESCLGLTSLGIETAKPINEMAKDTIWLLIFDKKHLSSA